ncbi:extensin isoform X1 [Asparagus officinalis]|uniref:extensin isoform X1 n=1 Tax=Asparagus officinalis TaxID=4686 RepID=UPI00098E1464|nr:extensin isoform X1 [Asparagus officinalis]XP_020256703.1 extensin isoform X1 [Asparagus officinalis]XP_020256704.1 extensin isoform X1 [Asparagus officinalis]
MEQRFDCLGILLMLFYFFYATSFFASCAEARKSLNHPKGPQTKAVKQHLVTYYSTSDPNSNYVGSPYYLRPYEDVMGPSSSPLDQNPPYCIYPPLTPFPPSTTIPSPILPIRSPPPSSSLPSPNLPSQSPPSPSSYIYPPIFTPNLPSQSPPSPSSYIYPPIFTPNLPSQSPPSPSSYISPPIFTPNPPEFPTPSPPGLEPSPPNFEPSPPGLEPSPPGFGPSPPAYYPGPPIFSPGPPIFLPPIVYPPPTVPPPPHVAGTTGMGLWCVAKPTVPDPIIQEAMNYACASGANCDAIQPNGQCYQPDTLIAHASFAFNSYWQRTKVAGGTCDFGGTAMLITKDPSFNECHFSVS